MPSLRPKPRAGSTWLPNQVANGIDCSDDNPEKWQRFGEEVDKEQTKTIKPKVQDPPRVP